MNLVKKLLRLVAKTIAILVVFGALIWGSTQFFSRQEKALAQKFVDLLVQRDFSAAYEYFAEDAKAVVPLNTLQIEFDRLAQDYGELTFIRINLGTSGTTLIATATTGDGCTSQFGFRFIDEKLQRFDIEHLCFEGEYST